jgi:hypothetical protein
MEFSLHSASFSVNKYTFGPLPQEISSFIGKEEQMKFNEDGTVSFMNFIWLGREFENDS